MILYFPQTKEEDFSIKTRKIAVTKELHLINSCCGHWTEGTLLGKFLKRYVFNSNGISMVRSLSELIDDPLSVLLFVYTCINIQKLSIGKLTQNIF